MLVFSKLHQYYILMRMDSLTGAWLLVIPSFWSIAYYTDNFNLDIIKLYTLFLVGSILMRSFGCIINDLADMDIDAKIQRTKQRPLASKLISKKEAYVLLFILIGLAFVIWWQLDPFAQIIALLSLVLVIFYPFSKRFLKAPQLILGLTFAWPIFVVDAQINQSLGLTSLLMYIATVFWVISYDTIYAYQDYTDDKNQGVKSLAVTIGENPKMLLSLCYIIFFMVMLAAGLLAYKGILFIIGLSIATSFILIKLLNLDIFNNNQCLLFFKHNVIFGLIIWVVLFLSFFIQ